MRVELLRKVGPDERVRQILGHDELPADRLDRFDDATSGGRIECSPGGPAVGDVNDRAPFGAGAFEQRCHVLHRRIDSVENERADRVFDLGVDDQECRIRQRSGCGG